jgi:hypothetical protein
MSTKTKGQISFTRLMMVIFSFGLLAPVIGIRKPIGRSRVITTSAA